MVNPYAEVKDLLDRESEIVAIKNYVEAFHQQGRYQIDVASTLAISGEYGEGKSFVLEKLRERMSDHSTAFVDCWSDDLSNDPLIALCVAVEDAFNSKLKKDEHSSKALKTFRKNAGQLAKEVGKGAFIRILGLAITHTVAESVTEQLSQATDHSDLESSDLDLSDAIEKGLARDEEASVSTYSRRSDEFRQSKALLADIRESLCELVSIAEDSGENLPLVIFIDELDRCRPDYAIDLLESIKHFFSVPGIFFILALNRAQLAASISGAYGPSFDGDAYLRRFIGRTYFLRTPSFEAIIEDWIQRNGIPLSKWVIPRAYDRGPRVNEVGPARVLNSLAHATGISTRDLKFVLDRLQVAAAITSSVRIDLTFYAAKTIHREFFSSKTPIFVDWVKNLHFPNLVFAGYDVHGKLRSVNLRSYIEAREAHQSLDREQFFAKLNNNELSANIAQSIFDSAGHPTPELGHPFNYDALVNTVGHFDEPDRSSPA